jgi:hypothetical protein
MDVDVTMARASERLAESAPAALSAAIRAGASRLETEAAFWRQVEIIFGPMTSAAMRLLDHHDIVAVLERERQRAAIGQKRAA